MLDKLKKLGVVPVVAVDNADDGLRLCEALLAAELPVVEITFRTAAAEATITAVSKRLPEMLLGAGTVLNVHDLKRAQAAGASFAVAPGCNPTVLHEALHLGLPFFPGVCTPSDVERALECGASTLKFFPAEAAGGLEMLKAMAAPYAHLKIGYMPTGGISPKNLKDYLALPFVVAVGGTWIAKKETIAAGKFAEITTLAREARQLARG